MIKTKKEASLTYMAFGSGEAIVVAIHGFGQDTSVFKGLKDKKVDSTIYSISLPIFEEGKALIKSSDDFSYRFIIQFEKLLNENDIKNFELVAFSIGAKIALVVAERYSESIDKITLLAPDGITKRWIYTLSTSTILGRGVFYFFTRYIFIILPSLAKVLLQFRLLSKDRVILIERLVKTKSQMLLFNTWQNCRFYRPVIKSLRKNMSGKVEFEIILASSDTIIKRRHILPFLNYFPETSLKTLRSSHEKLIQRWIESI